MWRDLTACSMEFHGVPYEIQKIQKRLKSALQKVNELCGATHCWHQCCHELYVCFVFPQDQCLRLPKFFEIAGLLVSFPDFKMWWEWKYMCSPCGMFCFLYYKQLIIHGYLLWIISIALELGHDLCKPFSSCMKELYLSGQLLLHNYVHAHDYIHGGPGHCF